MDENGDLTAMLPERSNKDDSIRKAGVRTFKNVADRWQLSEAERMRMLGFDDHRAYELLMNGEIAASPPILERLSLCLGIYKALHTIFSEPSHADKWLRRPNKAEMFGGKTAIEFIIDNGDTGLRNVRQYLDAQCF